MNGSGHGSAAGGRPSPRSLIIFLPAAIAVVTFFTYIRCYNGAFTNWDDNSYAYYCFQQLEKTGSPLKIAVSFFFTPAGNGGGLSCVNGNFHPLTMLSMCLDYRLSPAAPGSDPPVSTLMFHATSVVLHIVNTLLVFAFAFLLMRNVFTMTPPHNNGTAAGRLDGGHAAAVAAIASLLFGVHPLHAESVAWISERKDVLYTLWFLLSLIFYLHYITGKRRRWFWGALAAFFLSLLSKGQAVPLAFAVTLIDFAAGRPLLSKKVLLEKVPFYLLAFAFGIIAVKAQAHEHAVLAAHGGVGTRAVLAALSLTMYLFRTAVPVHLSAFYPFPDTAAGVPLVYYLSFVPVAALLVWITVYAGKSKKLFFGPAFFAITMVLLLQFIPFGKALMADRYMYLSSAGLFLLIGIVVESAPEKIRWPARALVLGYAMILAGLTVSRCGVWKDSITLWSDCIARYPDNALAYHNRASALHEIRDFAGAVRDENAAIRLDPAMAEAYYNRGNARFSLGDLAGAESDISQCIERNPGLREAYYLRGRTRFLLRQGDKAFVDFDSSVLIDPRFTLGYLGRALCRAQAGNRSAALADYDQVLRLDSRCAAAYYGRGIIYLQEKNNEAACSDLRRAAQLGYPPAVESFQRRCGETSSGGQ